MFRTKQGKIKDEKLGQVDGKLGGVDDRTEEEEEEFDGKTSQVVGGGRASAITSRRGVGFMEK